MSDYGNELRHDGWQYEEPPSEAEQAEMDRQASIAIGETTYKIVRFKFDGENEVIRTGLSLDEAQEWCNREDTHGDGWFDGYEQESTIEQIDNQIEYYKSIGRL